VEDCGPGEGLVEGTVVDSAPMVAVPAAAEGMTSELNLGVGAGMAGGTLGVVFGVVVGDVADDEERRDAMDMPVEEAEVDWAGCEVGRKKAT
jgi:hypothetical protein